MTAPRLCPSEMAAALPTTTQHPAPKITLRNFTKISFFGVVIFCTQVSLNANAIMPP